ncbi:14475_t:CDS:2 [Cetraspora pellucida]|uniref:14475_t:CDS:1 n=1 Tax=Cetraspora pellucida TaxID=1433469 RepID=A0A9N9CB57_9GLOM|nr:14475_t:CDS:2 [Cetraspora pellucida]
MSSRNGHYLRTVVKLNKHKGKCPREDSLRKCLDQYIKGTLNYRDDFFDYSADLEVEYNQQIIHFPVAFVHPIDVLDVQNAIKCGTELDYPIVARSGGHSYEGYGIGDKDCYLVVDLVNFNKTTIDITSQTAIIETGNKLNSLYYSVNQYGFASPGGVCPFIGVGGLITGGGVGFLNRKFGFSSDNILDAQIVLANGTIVNNANKYPELLWAIRGAGNAGYGIITTLTLKIYPIPKVVTSLTFRYDWDQIPLIISVMNQFGNNFHQNLTLLISIFKFKTYIDGIYLGSADELQPHVQEFIKLTKPKSVSYSENDLYNLLTRNSGSFNETGSFKVKSFFINSNGLSGEGVQHLMKFIESFECGFRIEIILLGGGRVNEIMRNETAFVHRGFMNHMEIKAVEPSEMCLQNLKFFAHHFQQKYTNYESYQNLIDRQLDNWQCRYYRENFEKLVEIKRKYDPYNVFHWNQSIPINTEISC